MNKETKEVKQALAIVPKGEAAAMEQFHPKKQNIIITFFDNEKGSKEYLDIKGYSLNGPYLVVQEHDDTQYVYPMATVALLKLFVTE